MFDIFYQLHGHILFPLLTYSSLVRPFYEDLQDFFQEHSQAIQKEAIGCSHLFPILRVTLKKSH